MPGIRQACLLIGIYFASLVSFGIVYAQTDAHDTSLGDEMIAAYFQAETQRLADSCLEDVQSLEQWQRKRPQYKQQLLEMLGLDPFPERTDLQVAVAAETGHEQFTVRRLQFQSRPGLYVTANLYVPKEVQEPLPAILYVCGHGPVKENGISYGNKVHYQHHGGWFARNGYVCLVIDTLQLGEIEGIHHGTYRENMWWWLNRGYTPAGVEAWNCIRAIDLLQSLDEVDPERIGVTGRSGGGAYSWWISAIDDRIKCAVPVAGITDLQNHVVDGCVEGHCDCMYMVNTYRWDYPMVAALVAPRPLLISNTDRDTIFPLDGVYRTYMKAKQVYELYDAEENVALNITAGGHDDTQELRIHAFHWLNHFLKGDDGLIGTTAVRYFDPPQLKVLDEIPADERNTAIHDSFVHQETPALPSSQEQWKEMQSRWRHLLAEKVFAAWPTTRGEVSAIESVKAERDGIVYRIIDFTSQDPIKLQIHLLHQAGVDAVGSVDLNVLEDDGWQELLAALRPAFERELGDAPLPDADAGAFQQLSDRLKDSDRALAYVAPRGIGATRWDQSEKKQIQNRRRFYLLGQTLDGQRIYDVRRAILALRQQPGLQDASIQLNGKGRMAGVALYASLFEPDIAELDLYDLPTSHREGPFLLNVTRFFDLPQAVALAAENTRIVLHGADAANWAYPLEVVDELGWDSEALTLAK